MQRKTAAQQITEGVIWKQLLLFFFPILLGTFFQQMYNTVDTIVVGRFVGTQALAAVGAARSRVQDRRGHRRAGGRRQVRGDVQEEALGRRSAGRARGQPGTHGMGARQIRRVDEGRGEV